MHGITKREIQTNTGVSVGLVEFVERGRAVDMTIYSDYLKETVICATIPYQKSCLAEDETMTTIVSSIIKECGMVTDDAAFVQEQISFVTGYYEDPAEDPSIYKGCKIPAPYRVTPNGVYQSSNVYNKGEKEMDTEDKLLTSTPIIISEVGVNVDSNEQWIKVQLETCVGTQYMGWNEFKDLMCKDGIKNLIGMGLASTEADIKDMNKYLLALYVNNAQDLPRSTMASTFGWKNNHTAFVMGDLIISDEGVKPAQIVPFDEKRPATTSGTVTGWVKGVAPILNYELARFKCYALAAAPLIDLLGNHAFLVEHVSPSGSGKSTTALIPRSMFGMPSLMDPTSTARGIAKVGEMYGAIGLVFDETRAVGDFQSHVYDMINTNDRATSDKDQNLRESKRVNTVVMTTSEASILNDNSFEGIQARVLTITDKLPYLPIEVPQADKAVNLNYGHIGALFITKVLKYKDILIPRYQRELKRIPDSEVTQAGRRKAHFAVMALAGNILEEVFQDLAVENPDLDGFINPMNARDVCTKYFQEAVVENAFVPQEVQALKTCYDLIHTNPRNFYYETCTEAGTTNTITEGPSSTVYGWVSENRIDLVPASVNEYLESVGQIGLKQLGKLWKAAGILSNSPDAESRITSRVYKMGTAGKSRVNVISLDRKEVEKMIGMDEVGVGDVDPMTSLEVERMLKVALTEFADQSLTYKLHTDDVASFAKAFYDEKYQDFISYGVTLRHVEDALIGMRLV